MLPVRMLSTSTSVEGLKDPPGDSELPQLPEVVEALLHLPHRKLFLKHISSTLCSLCCILGNLHPNTTTIMNTPESITKHPLSLSLSLPLPLSLSLLPSPGSASTPPRLTDLVKLAQECCYHSNLAVAAHGVVVLTNIVISCPDKGWLHCGCCPFR